MAAKPCSGQAICTGAPGAGGKNRAGVRGNPSEDDKGCRQWTEGKSNKEREKLAGKGFLVPFKHKLAGSHSATLTH